MTLKTNSPLLPRLPESRRPVVPEVDFDLDLKWNAHAVQLLINDAQRRGETPVVLCLGRLQASALKAHLSSLFEGGIVTTLRNQVYAGLKIVELKVDSHLRVETLRSIYNTSRHAEHARISEAMKRNRLDHGSAPSSP